MKMERQLQSGALGAKARRRHVGKCRSTLRLLGDLAIRFRDEEDGVVLQESVMLLFMIAVVSVIAMRFLGMMAADSANAAANRIDPKGTNVGG